MEWWPVTLTDWAVILSGIATATATIILAVTVRRQLSVMENETKSRLRPWIMPVELVPSHMTLEDGGTWKYNETMIKMAKDPTIRPDIVHYKMAVTNSGTIPAEISYTSIGQKEEFSKSAFKNKPMINSKIMVPNHDFILSIDVHYNELLNGGKYYIGISIEYTVDKKIFQSGAIYELSSNFIVLLDDWHD